MEYSDEDHMDDDTLQGQNESNEETFEEADDPKNDSKNSKADDIPKGDEQKSSEKINTNNYGTENNPVDGEKGRVKKSETVVVIKYGCKKCTKICYTESGYHTHLFRAHRIRNVKNYPAQIIEGTTVNPADVHVNCFGKKEKPKCDECGQLFFNESSIGTHKLLAHRASGEETHENDGVQKKSTKSEDTKKDEDEEKLEKGRRILNTMIRKQGSKKTSKLSQRKPKSPHKISKWKKNTKL